MHLWLHWNGAEFNFCHDVIINLRCVPFESVLNYILKINNSWTNLNVQTSAARRCAPLLQLVRYVNEASRTETKANTLIFISNNVSQYCGNQSERHFYFEFSFISATSVQLVQAVRMSHSNELCQIIIFFRSSLTRPHLACNFCVTLLPLQSLFSISVSLILLLSLCLIVLWKGFAGIVSWNCFLKLFFQGFVCSRWPLLNYLNLF